jgi:P-type E1-E2 ATPase
MVHVPIPGRDDLWLEHLVLDINGTLTDRAQLIAGVADALAALRDALVPHLLSADTFGRAEQLAEDLRVDFRRVANGDEKRAYVQQLGAPKCAAVGNGANDAPMLEAAALGIAVLGREGTHPEAVAAADVLASSIDQALAMLSDPKALTATLRP